MAQADSISQPQDSLYSSLSMEGTQANVAPPSLTHEQYNQLISLLSQHSSIQERGVGENIGAAGFYGR